MGRSDPRSAESGGSPAILDPGAGSGPVGTDAAVSESPAVVRPHQVVAVAAPVVDAAVGDGEEVTAGPGPIGPVQLDQDVAHVVPDAGRPGAGSKVAAGAGDEGPNRIPTAVGGLALDLEDTVGGEELDEVVEPTAVDAVRVSGDGVTDVLARLELPGVHGWSLAPLGGRLTSGLR